MHSLRQRVQEEADLDIEAGHLLLREQLQYRDQASRNPALKGRRTMINPCSNCGKLVRNYLYCESCENLNTVNGKVPDNNNSGDNSPDGRAGGDKARDSGSPQDAQGGGEAGRLPNHKKSIPGPKRIKRRH